MNLYRISPSESFLEILADFILDKFDDKNSINNLRIILPNGIDCQNLKNILIKRQDVAILPNIIPISNITVEGEEIFKLSSGFLEPITLLQEKIILSEIITGYPKSKFTTNQALQFSSNIAELFYELKKHNISLDDINEIEQRNFSQHWQNLYQFLKYIYQEWEKRLILFKTQDRLRYQSVMMDAEVSRLNNPNTSLVIAGIIGYDPISWQFLANIAKFSSAFIILPPVDHIADELLKEPALPEEDCLYSLKRLLTYLDKKLSDFQLLGGGSQYNAILTKLIAEDNNANIKRLDDVGVKYFELEDIFEEAEQISLLCQKHSDKQIAIIVNKLQTKDIYCNFLNKYSLEYRDLFGNDLSQSLVSSLIISVSEILCNNFDIKKLFLLLKHPLINCQLVEQLELLITNKKLFILSSSQLLSLIEETGNEQLIEWSKNLLNILYQNIDNNFVKLLKSSIKVAEKIYPDIWYEKSAIELSNFLSELIKNNPSLVLENNKYFPETLKLLISGHKYFNTSNYSKNIIIGKIEDLILLKFDIVILADFNQGSWAFSSSMNKWINEKILQELNIDSGKIKSSIYQYFFYLALHNNQVIITRSKRQNGKSGLLPSDLLLKLQFILGKKLNPKKLEIKNCQNLPINNKTYIHSPIFPEVLSVTSIEMLIRNPYSFYAKNILNLRFKDMIGEDPKISDFGIFIHRILEQYTKNYNQLEQDKVQVILDISNNILQSIILPDYTKRIWQTKFTPIADDFIEFDEQRRKNCQSIYSECRGEIVLNIADQELKIIAVADRIEVDKYGQAVIIDYKTGTLPTKKDVDSGLSPQLIIEALILAEGGFNIKAENVKQVIYVKLSSSKPYIQVMEINLTKEELFHHKQAMIKLLEYYIRNKNFPYDIDLLTYNDYSHLARKS
ncbi:MAG: PD-(D/E)XK nuclease family protein [Candidatus Rickettsia vulgarisii]